MKASLIKYESNPRGQKVIFDVTLISAKSTVDGEAIAECEMKIFLKKD